MPLTNIDGQRLGDSVADKLGNRNLIDNGAMQVSQRSTSVTSVTTTNYHTVDRFKLELNTLGTWTLTQESDGPDGFANSFKLNCTTADASPAAGDFCLIHHKIEAQYLQHLKYGTSSAEALTLSFYVKSNKTGTASVGLLQSDSSNKLYSAEYTINSANTWERKTILVPADTAGVINDDNGSGMQIDFWLNSGSDFSGGSFGGWSAYDATNRNVSNLGVGGAVNDYFQITGVQLEVGNTATPFEHRTYLEDLARCQRYFQGVDSRNDTNVYHSYGHGMFDSSTSCYGIMYFQTEMRAPPSSISSSGGTNWYVQSGGTAITNWTTIAIDLCGRNNGLVRFTGGSGGTVGRVGRWLANNNTTRFCFFSADL